MVRLIVAVVYLLLIAFAMLTPGDKFPEVDVITFQDKIIHFICFGGLTFLCCGVGVDHENKNLNTKRILINFLIFGIAAGIILEYMQLYIPYRSFDYMDMTVNIIGGFIGLLAYFKIPTPLLDLH